MSQIKIVFPKSAERYAALQCNSNVSDYTDCPELDPLHDLFARLKPKKVLELGAGLGRGSVYLRNRYNWDETDFYLADGNSGTEQVAGIHYTLESNFYNSLTATREFCNANHIAQDRLFLIDLETDSIPNKQFDLCFSLKSIGFHWPINEYLNILKQKVASKALLLFELRNPTGYAASRTDRISAYVKKQIDGIDRTAYEIVQYYEYNKFPILVLTRS